MISQNKFSGKTWKRELALAVFLWLIYLSVWGDIEALRIVAAPAFTYIGLAFGIDWWGKSNNEGKP